MNRRQLIKLAIGGAAAVVAAPAAAFNVPARFHYWYAAGLMFTRRGPWLIAVKRESDMYWARQVVCKRADEPGFVFMVEFAGEEIWDDRDKIIGYIAGMADSSYQNYKHPPQLRGYSSAVVIG